MLVKYCFFIIFLPNFCGMKKVKKKVTNMKYKMY